MPRAFTAVEKETIREKLMGAGRDCFLRYGLKKTTIEDLTKPAGIAKASFYLFFESKEQLFIDVFLEEIPAMMSRLTEASFGATDDVVGDTGTEPPSSASFNRSLFLAT